LRSACGLDDSTPLHPTATRITNKWITTTLVLAFQSSRILPANAAAYKHSKKKTHGSIVAVRAHFFSSGRHWVDATRI